MIMSINTEWV